MGDSMQDKKTNQPNFHIPSRGVVDDRNTLEGQLVGVRPNGSHQRLQSARTVQLKKYLPGLKGL